MRVINVVMPDKEFDSYWKLINKYIEEKEQTIITFAKIEGIEPWKMFVGMFGFPEELFDSVIQGANFVGQEYLATGELRFIKAVLKG